MSKSDPLLVTRDDLEDVDEREVQRAGVLALFMGRRLYKFAGLVFVLALLFRYFDAVSRVLLLAFVGIIIGIVFNAIVVRLPVKRGIGTGIVAILTFGVIGVLSYLGGSAIAAQVQAFIADLPSIIENVDQWVSGALDDLGLDIELTGPRVQEMLSGVIGGVSGGALIGGAFGVLEIVAITLLVLMGAFFVVAKPNDQLLMPLMRAVPQRRRPAYRRMLALMGERLSGWLIGTFVSMVAVGVLSTIAFYLLGVPYPLLLGILNGVLNIIPLLGAWIGGLIAIIVTLFGNPGMLLWVVIAVIAIQELEGNLIRPMAMSSAAKVHPFVTLLALLLFSSMFGILGAILSIPIVLAIGTMIEVLWIEETLEAQDDEIEPMVQS
jgi:predicted PurR-regulated permease PerM